VSGAVSGGRGERRGRRGARGARGAAGSTHKPFVLLNFMFDILAEFSLPSQKNNIQRFMKTPRARRSI
jgi:hypothetical protein